MSFVVVANARDLMIRSCCSYYIIHLIIPFFVKADIHNPLHHLQLQYMNRTQQ